VLLDSDRHYRFAVPPAALWSALAETADYRRWWPWLTAFEANGLVAGDVWRCAVRAPLPYTLRFAIDLDEVVPTTLVVARVSGDIEGTARLDVVPHGEGCEVRLTSRLRPSGRAFGLVARLARPIVRRGHDWVLDTGARQFVERAVAER
jgi:uncharacterized protein YndB with AHSA1/START domain